MEENLRPTMGTYFNKFLEVMERVASPYAGITLDITHLVPTAAQDAYAQIAACIPYATNAHIMESLR